VTGLSTDFTFRETRVPRPVTTPNCACVVSAGIQLSPIPAKIEGISGSKIGEVNILAAKPRRCVRVNPCRASDHPCSLIQLVLAGCFSEVLCLEVSAKRSKISPGEQEVDRRSIQHRGRTLEYSFDKTFTLPEISLTPPSCAL
jgi:hypothetical protein